MFVYGLAFKAQVKTCSVYTGIICNLACRVNFGRSQRDVLRLASSKFPSWTIVPASYRKYSTKKEKHYALTIIFYRQGQTIETLDKAVIEDCAQLCKANSISGNKMNNVDVIYTMWSNLKKTQGMEAGQVSFHDDKAVSARWRPGSLAWRGKLLEVRQSRG